MLVPRLPASSKNDTIDLVFVSYWIHPVTEAQVILGKDKDCIEKKRTEAETDTASGK